MKLAALIVLAATPVCAGPLTTATCQDVWAMVETAIGRPVQASAPSLTGTGCVVRDIVIPPSGGYGVKVAIGSVIYSGESVDPQGDWLSAESLRVALTDLRVVQQTGDPATNWIFDAQSPRDGFDLVIDLSHDAASDAWLVNRFSADLSGDNGWTASARIIGLDLSNSTAAALSLRGARLTDLDLVLDMDGFVESYLLVPFGRPLIDGSPNPDARVTELKDQAISLIRSLPDASVNASSKATLSDLVTDLPKPKGRLELTLTSDAGFGAANMLPIAVSGFGDDPAKALATLLNGVAIDASWTRTP